MTGCGLLLMSQEAYGNVPKCAIGLAGIEHLPHDEYTTGLGLHAHVNAVAPFLEHELPGAA